MFTELAVKAEKQTWRALEVCLNLTETLAREKRTSSSKTAAKAGPGIPTNDADLKNPDKKDTSQRQKHEAPKNRTIESFFKP